MSNRVYIMCAGKQVRFHGPAKHLLKINNDTLLERTISFIATRMPRRKIVVVTTYDIKPYTRTVLHETFEQIRIPESFAKLGMSIASALSLNLAELEDSLILLGDVVWDYRDLMNALNLRPREVLWSEYNSITDKDYPEYYAACIPKDDLPHMPEIHALRNLPVELAYSKRERIGFTDDIDRNDETVILAQIEKIIKTQDFLNLAH